MDLKRLNKLIEERSELIDKLEKELQKFISGFKNKYYAVWLEILNRLEDDGGILKTTARNLSLRTIEKDVLKDFDVKPQLIEKILKSFGTLNIFADGYFDEMDVPFSSAAKARSNKVFDDLLKAYGFDVNGGLIATIVDDSEVFRKTRLIVLKNVFEGRTRQEAQKALKQYIIEDDGYSKHYHTITNDVYSQFDRSIHNEKAVALDVKTAIYQGGLISTSRPFCRKRNRQVFTTEEIRKFGTSADKYGGYSSKARGMFDGKNKNYNPMTDCGGYNCRHFYSYISLNLALRMRPSLADDFPELLKTSN